MKVLVINCGSSSLKFQLLNMENEELLAKGLVERIGIEGSKLVLKYADQKVEVVKDMKDHEIALKTVLDELTKEEYGIVKLEEINAVGHRVVHGAEFYSDSVLITDEVLEKIKECNELAPLHNPANVQGIESIQKLLPGVPNVGVFDTAFHQSMPKEAFLYALPYEYYEKYAVRRYGFHGTSHKYVSQKAAEVVGKKSSEINVITAHLGNGSSITAVQKGKSVDTSMGFTPLEGVAMGTRCGDLDPAILEYVMGKENLSIAEMTNILNKKSGVLGISGISSDFRDLEDGAKEGNERAQLALDIFRRRVKKYIASYMAVMGGADVIAFTGGIGENGDSDRAEILSNLEFMGIKIDPQKNKGLRGFGLISADDSKVKVYVIPTNEELAIAMDTVEIVQA